MAGHLTASPPNFTETPVDADEGKQSPLKIGLDTSVDMCTLLTQRLLEPLIHNGRRSKLINSVSMALELPQANRLHVRQHGEGELQCLGSIKT